MPPEISPLLDDVARKLLQELQRNGRASYAELARKSGLSPSAAAERLRRLEDAGVIRGYRAEIDPEALGLGLTALIRITADGPQYRALITFLEGCDQVRECYHVTGGDALMLKVLAASIADLEELIMKLLHYGVPTTSVVLSAPIERKIFQLDTNATRLNLKKAPSKSKESEGVMMRTLLPLILLALVPVPGQGEALTLRKSIQVRQLSDLRFSPDGARLAFTLQEPVSGRRAESHVWVFEPATRQLRQWTRSAKSERMPRWSPGGAALAFLSDREDSNEIWLMPVAGGEATRLTIAKQGVQSFRWSPDGRQIAFLATDPKPPEREKLEKELDDSAVADSGEHFTRVWVLDMATRSVRRVTSGSWHVTELEWFPSADRLALVATDRPAADQRTEKLYSVSLAGPQEPQLITAPRGPFRGIQVSPSGRQIAWLASSGDGPSPHDLFVFPLDSGTPRNLSVKNDRPVQSFQWRGENDMAVLFADGFRTSLRLLGEKPGFLAADGTLDVSAFALDAKGRASTVQESAISPPELHWEGAPVSQFNDGLRSLSLAAPEFYRYRSFDGMEIEAALYRGTGPAAVRPQPLVVLIHGGPAGNWRNRFDSLTQLLAAKGYTVMQPNIRGSIAYGQKFLESNRADWGGGDYKDAMAGVDDLIRRGIADPARLAIGGWSYGGYMAEWAITQTDRFKAAYSGAGMADLAAEYGTEIGPEEDEWYYGIPYENPDGFRKSSPITFIRNAKTPTLILQGEADTTDPLSQSQILYRGLKRYNVPAEMVVYPREPHGFREEKHILDRDARIIAWFEKYLGPA